MKTIDTLKQNVDITHLSNFKTPAKTKYYFEFQSLEDKGVLSSLYRECLEYNLPFLVVSGGTNVLFAFDIFEGVIVHNTLKWFSYDSDKMVLQCFGAEKISDISETLETQYHQNIWHRFIGLPGTIAGAVSGNAGCFWLETSNNFSSAQILDMSTWQILFLSQEEMNFSYRSSLLKMKPHFFLLQAFFDLSKVVEKYQSDVDNIDFRKNKQPKGNSCGSFFKNPSSSQSAGSLIEQVWLKGYKHKGAYFSDLHANFLMHDGNGTYKDICELIDMAQEKILNAFGITLIPEVQIIYERGK